MNSIDLSPQEVFQLAVSDEYERLEKCVALTPHVKHLILEYLQTSAGSSDEPVSLKERADLGRETIEERRDVSALDLLVVKRLGNTVLDTAVRV